MEAHYNRVTLWEKVAVSGKTFWPVAGANESVISKLNAPAEVLKSTHAAWQPSGDRRRKGSGENPIRLPWPDAEGWHEVLRHQRAWRSRANLSHESMGRDR